MYGFGQQNIDYLEHKDNLENEHAFLDTENRPDVLVPEKYEHIQLLQSLNEMRQRGEMCDFVLNIRGVKFLVHKVVVCAGSRWLRSIVESEQAEIQLDMFDPESFVIVLGYMYGQAIQLDEKNVDAIMAIIKRLGLQALEQKCWSYLLMIVESTNCMKLHELADRYECAPLKLSAWKVIQESFPGYAVAPARLLEAKQFRNEKDEHDGDDESSYGEDIPSIFAVLTNEDMATYVPPTDLPAESPADMVVKSWAIRLQLVWQECHPGDQGDLHDSCPSETKVTTSANCAVDYNDELVRFYMVHNPDKVRDIPEILDRFRGNESSMLISLYQKYNVSIPDGLQQRLNGVVQNNSNPFLRDHFNDQPQANMGNNPFLRGRSNRAPPPLTQGPTQQSFDFDFGDTESREDARSTQLQGTSGFASQPSTPMTRASSGRFAWGKGSKSFRSP